MYIKIAAMLFSKQQLVHYQDFQMRYYIVKVEGMKKDWGLNMGNP